MTGDNTDDIFTYVVIAILVIVFLVIIREYIKTALLKRKLRLRNERFMELAQSVNNNNTARTLDLISNIEMRPDADNIRNAQLESRRSRWPFNERDEVCDLLLARNTLQDLRVKMTPSRATRPAAVTPGSPEPCLPPPYEEHYPLLPDPFTHTPPPTYEDTFGSDESIESNYEPNNYVIDSDSLGPDEE